MRIQKEVWRVGMNRLEGIAKNRNEGRRKSKSNEAFFGCGFEAFRKARFSER